MCGGGGGLFTAVMFWPTKKHGPRVSVDTAVATQCTNSTSAVLHVVSYTQSTANALKLQWSVSWIQRTVAYNVHFAGCGHSAVVVPHNICRTQRTLI